MAELKVIDAMVEGEQFWMKKVVNSAYIHSAGFLNVGALQTK